MQFSMIFEVQLADPTPESEGRVYRETVEQAVLGEAVGFDRVWAVEHHNLRYMGTVPQDACLESIRLIGGHVIPEYASVQAGGRRAAT